MTRDGFKRMDVDTQWAYHRKMRRLQRLHPRKWPTFAAAYLILLGESWAATTRVTLDESWCAALPCSPDEAITALTQVGLLEDGRIPEASWSEWFVPVADAVEKRRESGRIAAAQRWESERNATALASQSVGNTPPARPSVLPGLPARPPVVGRGTTPSKKGTNDGDEARATAEYVTRLMVTIDDDATSDDRRQAARMELNRLGVTA